MKHKYKVIYENIILRPLEKDDLEMLRRWRNSDNIREWFINRNIITEEQQLQWFEKYKSQENDIMFIIKETRELNRAVGAVSLYNINSEQSEAEFGRLMVGDPEARGKGIGVNATKAVCDFGFNKLCLKKIILEVFEDNFAAKKIYINAGFNVINKISSENKIIVRMEKTKD